jgi:hypothetical protein
LGETDCLRADPTGAIKYSNILAIEFGVQDRVNRRSLAGNGSTPICIHQMVVCCQLVVAVTNFLVHAEFYLRHNSAGK